MFDIVIPVFNEALRLPATCAVLKKYADNHPEIGTVIMVDDQSTDATSDVIREWQTRWPGLVGITNSFKGKGSAVRTGMKESRADFTLFTDADLSTPIEHVEALYAALQSHSAEIAIGSRRILGSTVSGRSPTRKLLSWGVNALDHLILGNDVYDSQCGFKLFSRRAREIVFSRQTIDGFGFDMELLAIAKLHGLKVAEVPVAWSHVSQSRVHAFRDSTRIFSDMMRIRILLNTHKYS